MDKQISNIVIPRLRIFLSLFDLDTEDKEDIKVDDSLEVFYKNKVYGTVLLKENDILIKTITKYGYLESITNYNDIKNEFDFELKSDDINYFNGTISFDIIYDDKYGDVFGLHFRLKYNKNNKRYSVIINDEGFLFDYIEKEGTVTEEIRFKTLEDKEISEPQVYHKSSEGLFYISNSFLHKDKHTLVRNTIYDNVYEEFDKIKEGNYFNADNIMEHLRVIDPTIDDKISEIFDEFRVNGNSFLENMVMSSLSEFDTEYFYTFFKRNNRKINKRTRKLLKNV